MRLSERETITLENHVGKKHRRKSSFLVEVKALCSCVTPLPGFSSLHFRLQLAF
jgi:hypothetical protein